MNRPGNHETHKYQRRKYIINPGFQWKYAVMIALAVFMVSSVISVVLYGVLHDQARLRSAHPETYVAPVTAVILLFALAFSVVTAGGVGFWSIIVTHRICGPIFVLKGWVLELTKGRFPKVRPLRRKDEFKDLFSAFAGAIDSLKANKRSELAALTQVLETAQTAAGDGSEDHQSALRSVASRIGSLRRQATEALGDEVDEAPSTPVRPSRSTSSVSSVAAASSGGR